MFKKNVNKVIRSFNRAIGDLTLLEVKHSDKYDKLAVVAEFHKQESLRATKIRMNLEKLLA